MLAGLPRAPSRFNSAGRSGGGGGAGARGAGGDGRHRRHHRRAGARGRRARSPFRRAPRRRRLVRRLGAEQAQAAAAAKRGRGGAHHAGCAAAGDRRRRGWRRCSTGRARRRASTQGAVVVLDAATGAVRAMVGGRDYRSQPLQPRGAGAAPAGLGVQAVRLAGRAGEGRAAGRPGAGRADPARQLEPGELRRQVPRRDHAGGSAGRRVNTAAVRLLLQAGGPRPVAAVARAARHRRHPAGRCHRWRWAPARSGCWNWPAPMPTFFNGGLRVTPTRIEAMRTRRSPSPRRTPPGAGDRARSGGDDGAHDGRGGGARQRPGGGGAGRAGGRQDRHDAGLPRRLVRRLRSTGRSSAVWLGNDDNRPMKDVTGGSLPARLFREIAS